MTGKNGQPILVLITKPDLPVASMKDLVEYAKKNKVNYGSAGQGSLTHLAMEQLKQAAGFDAVHAPYRGIVSAMTRDMTASVIGGPTDSDGYTWLEVDGPDVESAGAAGPRPPLPESPGPPPPPARQSGGGRGRPRAGGGGRRPGPRFHRSRKRAGIRGGDPGRAAGTG